MWVYELFEDPARPDDAWDADSARYLVELQMEDHQLSPGLVSDPNIPRDATEGPEIDAE